MPRRLAPYLLAVLIATTSTIGLGIRPATGAAQTRADYVIIAGVPGLRWEDLDPLITPTLWALAQRGSIGSLSVRSARQPTCPVDGWETLGAGNYAAGSRETPAAPCPPVDVALDRPDRLGAFLPDQRAIGVYNRNKLRFGAVPGALAGSVRCSVAIGTGAAVAAARPFGRVDRYAPKLPADAARLLASCVLSIVDLGTVTGEDPMTRAAQVRSIDARAAELIAARPPNSLLIVAGVADAGASSRLHVAIADGPGWNGGWLTSASTGRSGYLQLIDLAPTALATLGRPSPDNLFAGHPASRVAGRPADLRTAIAQPADADREAGAQRRVTTWFFALLAVVQLGLLIATVPLLRRARRHRGPGSPPPVPPRLVRTVETLLMGTALAIPAALAADAVPWWRSGHPGLLFAVAALAILAAVTPVVVAMPAFRRTLGPPAMVATLAVLVVGADVLTGARLQLNGVAGYSALEGGRYAGLGTVGLGVFIAGSLLTAGLLAQRVRRDWRPTVMALVGGVGVLVVGSPYLGADASGAVALTAGACIAAALSAGGWLTFPRLAWATLAGVAVTSGFAVLDLRRTPEERGSLGRFLSQLADGTGGLAMHRAGVANLVAFASSPLTVLAVGAGLYLWLALLSPWGGLKRLYGLYPAVRAAMAGTAVASIIAGLLGGAALNVAGAAAAVAMPLAAVAALRVLDHASDRTVVPGAVPLPAGPERPPAGRVAPATGPDPGRGAGRDAAAVSGDRTGADTGEAGAPR